MKEQDEEKLLRRKTKRLSKVSDETTDNNISKLLLGRIESQSQFEESSTRPRSTGSDDIEEDDDDLLGTFTEFNLVVINI